MTLRKATTPLSVKGLQPTGTLAELNGCLQNVDDFLGNQARRRQFLVVKWSSPANPDLAALHGALVKQLNTKYTRLPCVTYFGGTTLAAFIYRSDTAGITTSQLELPGCSIVAKCILNRGRRDNVMADAMQAFSDAAVACHSSIWIDVNCNELEWGLDQLHEATSHLDSEGLLRLVASVKLTPKKDRDEFQNSFFTLLPQLNELRTLKERVRNCGVAITMQNRATHMQSLDQFIPDILDLRVTIHDRSVWTSGECSLKEYLASEDLHQTLSLLVHGDTGLGKSEMVKLLFFTLSASYLDQDALLWHCNTIDQIRAFKNDMKAGQVLMLDEFNPVGAQVVHSDPNLIKVLVNPVLPGTVRARNDDVSLPTGLIRVITANSESLEHWLAPLKADPVDADAIRRRMATLQVSGRLWKNAARPPAIGRNGMNRHHTFEDALAKVQGNL